MTGAVRFAVKRRLALGVLGGACAIATVSAIGCSSTGQAPQFETDVDVTPAEQNIGERIFVDTRWAEYFADAHDRREFIARRRRSSRRANANTQWAAARAVCRTVDQLPVVPFRRRVPGSERRGQSHLRGLHESQPDPASDERVHVHAAQLHADGWLAPAAQWADVPTLRRRIRRSSRSRQKNNHRPQFWLGPNAISGGDRPHRAT